MLHETLLICDSEVADVLGFALVTLIEKVTRAPLSPCSLSSVLFRWPYLSTSLVSGAGNKEWSSSPGHHGLG